MILIIVFNLAIVKPALGSALFGGALALAPAPAAADGMGPHPFELELGGYGELGFAFKNYGPNQNLVGGAARERRLEFDSTRFVAAIEGRMPGDLEFEAELEVEHGGTGAAKEVEYEEFGEFEREVEKGGEVQLEELYLKKSFGRFDVAIGRFYVAFGHLSYRYRPDDYLTAARGEAETTMIPGQWDEMGAQVVAHLPLVRLTGQVVNGLDSTGFSSTGWVAPGHQGAFETIRATSLAAVLRADVSVAPAVEVGASGYFGGTSRNRPKDDLDVSAAVTLVDLHAAWRIAGLRGQALAMWGHLENARRVSERNDRLSNELGVERTPVGDNAYGVAAELGYDVAPHVCAGERHAIEPFVHLERYDTMARPRDELFDNPRFERTVLGAGLSYGYRGGFVAKLEASQRRFGASSIRSETTVHLMTGFTY